MTNFSRLPVGKRTYQTYADKKKTLKFFNWHGHKTLFVT